LGHEGYLELAGGREEGRKIKRKIRIRNRIKSKSRIKSRRGLGGSSS